MIVQYGGFQAQNAVSGIDPTYLSAHSHNNAATFIAGIGPEPAPDPTQVSATTTSFGNNYQSRTFVGPDRNRHYSFLPQHVYARQEDIWKTTRSGSANRTEHSEDANTAVTPNVLWKTTRSCGDNRGGYNGDVDAEKTMMENSTFDVSTKKPMQIDLLKNDTRNQFKMRTDILKALHKSGPRVFSGPIEKVLKWHKALQDIGVLILYEIVAKCVSIRQGESCAKNLVVRDDNGPAMQVVYYEIDFLLPQLRLPQTVRVLGRMMPGTCRLHAFSVRAASGDDVAMLARRAAVAAHHVTKLCKDYARPDKI